MIVSTNWLKDRVSGMEQVFASPTTYHQEKNIVWSFGELSLFSSAEELKWMTDLDFFTWGGSHSLSGTRDEGKDLSNLIRV